MKLTYLRLCPCEIEQGKSRICLIILGVAGLQAVLGLVGKYSLIVLCSKGTSSRNASNHIDIISLTEFLILVGYAAAGIR